MDFWDQEHESIRARNFRKRRDVTKFGISPPKLKGMNGTLFIPERLKVKVGLCVRYVEVPEGMAFKIAERGDYKVRVQNGLTGIMIAQAPYALCRFASEKATSIEVEDFHGGYLVRYDQFK
jgi:hypothetical protein